MNVLDYLEEEIGYVKSADMPETLLTAQIMTVSRGVLEGRTSCEEGEEDFPPFDETCEVLEFVVQNGLWDEPVKFVMVLNGSEGGEWVYASTLDDYIEENFYDQDDLTITYEVNDEEVF